MVSIEKYRHRSTSHSVGIVDVRFAETEVHTAHHKPDMIQPRRCGLEKTDLSMSDENCADISKDAGHVVLKHCTSHLSWFFQALVSHHDALHSSHVSGVASSTLTHAT